MSSQNALPIKKRWPSRSDAVFLGAAFSLALAGFFAIRGSRPPSQNLQPSVTKTVEKATIGERVTVSRATAIIIPGGAQIMREEAIVTDAARQLQRRAALISPSLRIEKLELLIWRRDTTQFNSKSRQNSRYEAIKNQVAAELENKGYLYQKTAQPEVSVREFVAVSRSSKRIVPGFWLESDEFLLLAWASFKPKANA